MAKKRLSDEEAKRIVEHCEEQILFLNADREELLDDLKEYDKIYEGRLEEKTWPWEDCSNIQVPLTSTNVDAIFAKMMGSIFSVSPFWNVLPLLPQGEVYEHAKSLERFLHYASVYLLKMYDVCTDWFLSGCKHGTAIAEVSWEETWKYRYKRHNDEVYKEPKLMYRGPKIRTVALHDFFIPSGYSKIQDAPFVGKRFYMTWPELLAAEREGKFRNVKEIKGHETRFPTDADQERAEEMGIDLEYNTGVYELHKIHLLWDFDDDGFYIPITVVYEPNSKQALMVDYYEYDHCQWPFVEFRYMPRERAFYGIGVIQMLERLQKGMDTMVNQNIDNATLANMRYYKARKGSVFGLKDGIYPGKVIHMDNPETDLISEQMGEVYSSLFSAAMNLQDWGEKRTGLTEYAMGRESKVIGSRATATSTLALIQEANRRFDMTLRDIRNASTEIGYQCLELWQQFVRGPYSYMYMPQQVNEELMELSRQGMFRRGFDKVKTAFGGAPPQEQNPQMQSVNFDEIAREVAAPGRDRPVGGFREKFLIELAASKESLNREVEKQNLLALQQMMMGYYERVVGLRMQISSPEVPPEAKATLEAVDKASTELTHRVLESYDIRDAAALIPTEEPIEGGQDEFGGAPPQGPPGMANPMGPNQGNIGGGETGAVGPPGPDVPVEPRVQGLRNQMQGIYGR